MWFMESIVLLVILTAITFCAGLPLLSWLSGENKNLSLEKFCLSLIYGTVTISFLYSIGAYCNFQGKYIGPVILLLIITSIFIFKKNWRFEVDKKNFFQFLFICFAATNISLLPLLTYNSIIPYNDTIVYINISDYLQSHGFLTRPIEKNGYHPLDTMGLTYHDTYSRMGANFFLAAFQSIFMVKKSIFIFPLAKTWAFILNLASITIAARWIFNMRSKYILVLLVLVVVSFNPLYYAIHVGFYNQLYGCAFNLLALAAFTRLLKNSNSKNAMRYVVMVSIFLSSVVIFYPEIFPFTFLSLLLCLFVPFVRPNKTDFQKWLFLLGSLTFLSLLLSNIAFVGMIKMILIEMSLVLGWNISFSFLEFITTALGIMPISSFNFFIASTGVIFLLIFLLGIFWIFKKNYIKYFPWLSAVIVFFTMFLYFYFFVSNPWLPQNHGQTWSMFKIMSWAFPCLVLGVGYGINQMRWNRLSCLILIILTGLTGKIAHPFYYQDSKFAELFTGSKSPFAAYQQFASVLNEVKSDQPIELVINKFKHKELLAYYLNPREMISDWREEGYLYTLKTEFKNIKIKAPHYVVISSAYALTDDAKQLPANTVLINSADPYIQSFENFYDSEPVSAGAMLWSGGNSSIKFYCPKTEYAKITLEILVPTVPSKILIAVSKNKTMELSIKKPGWNTLEIFSEVMEGENVLSIKSLFKPVKIGNDLRWFAFSIKKMRVYLHKAIN